MVLLSCSGTGTDIYAKLANGMARYNCARASPTRNSSVLRSLARRQPAQYRQVTHRQGSGRMTRYSDARVSDFGRVSDHSVIALITFPARLSEDHRLFCIRFLPLCDAPRLSGFDIGRRRAGLAVMQIRSRGTSADCATNEKRGAPLPRPARSFRLAAIK